MTSTSQPPASPRGPRHLRPGHLDRHLRRARAARAAACAIVDSVLDYDPKSGRTRTTSADKVIDYVQANDLQVEWILETHAHADHLSAAPYLKKQPGRPDRHRRPDRTRAEGVQGLFNLEPEFQPNGSQFDHLFADGEEFKVGALTGQVMSVPGHTPACVAYQFGDAVFVGDTLFMPDVGTARCDFPGGDARTLYASMRKLLSLPPQTRLFMCHDYPPHGPAGRRSRRPWQRSARRTSMCTTASPRRSSSPCAPSAMPRWRCRC